MLLARIRRRAKYGKTEAELSKESVWKSRRGEVVRGVGSVWEGVRKAALMGESPRIENDLRIEDSSENAQLYMEM